MPSPISRSDLYKVAGSLKEASHSRIYVVDATQDFVERILRRASNEENPLSRRPQRPLPGLKSQKESMNVLAGKGRLK